MINIVESLFYKYQQGKTRPCLNMMQNCIKKITFLIAFGVLLACTSKKQNGESFISTLPSFDLLLIDSITLFNTKDVREGAPTILIYFSPDCEHCQAVTKNLLNNIDSFKNVHIYFLTPMPFNEMKEFSITYHLSNYKNITVGTDYQFSFYRIFKPTGFPFAAIYNSHKKLLKIYNGDIGINKMLEAVRI